MMKPLVSNTLCNALLALALGVAQSVSADGGGQPAKPTDRQVKVLAEVAYLSTITSTNHLALAAFMGGDAKAAFQDIGRRTALDGRQCFMPDFCKVKYVVVGALDANGYVAGFYNPFYDAWFMLKVADAGKVVVEGFKVVHGGYFSNKARGGLPPASGAVPAAGYLPGVFSQVKTALTSMRDWFNGRDFRSLFDRMPDADDALLEYLSGIVKFRIGQALKITDDKRALRDSVIGRAIVCRGDTRRFVADDASTKLTLKTLSESLGEIRSGFKVVAYFPSGDESNLVFNHKAVPTLLIQANVRSDGMVHLRMFDANSITSEIK